MSIVLFSTGCPKCNILKKKLGTKGVTYTENNSVDEMLALGISQVPILKIGDSLLNFTDAVKWVDSQQKEVV